MDCCNCNSVKIVRLAKAFKIYKDYCIEEDKYPYYLDPYKEKDCVIEVAENIVELVRKELPLISLISKFPLKVVIGAEAEVYGPAEERYQLMPAILKEFLKYPGWHIRIVTKSDLVLRDIDILKKLNVLVTNCFGCRKHE